MKKIRVTRNYSEGIATLMAIGLFSILFLIVVSWSESVAHHQVNKAKHQPTWHREYAKVVEVGLPDDTKPIHIPTIVSYVDVFNHPRTTFRNLPSGTYKGESFLAYVSDHGQLWVKKGIDQSIKDPFKVDTGDDWFPAANIIVVGGFGNFLVCLLFGFLCEAFIFEWTYIYLPSPKRIWRKFIPEAHYITERVMVHSSDGVLRETTVKTKVRGIKNG